MAAKKKKREFVSFKEYLKAYYPSGGEHELLGIDDPRKFGAHLAQESFDKLQLNLKK